MCKFQKREKSNHHFPELNHKVNFWSRIRNFFSFNKIVALLIFLSLVFGFAYLAQTNLAATKGYTIQELDQQLNESREKNKRLNLQYIELQSMANVVDQVEEMDLVASTDVKIISSLGSAVALK